MNNCIIYNCNKDISEWLDKYSLRSENVYRVEDEVLGFARSVAKAARGLASIAVGMSDCTAVLCFSAADAIDVDCKGVAAVRVEAFAIAWIAR